MSFVGTYDVPVRSLCRPTINDLLERREQVWRTLTKHAIDDDWNMDPSEVHAMWAEKSLIDETLYERRMFGELVHLDGDLEAFLCHSSSDKGTVRMVHDDLTALGVKCWLDENKIKVGDSIVGKISEGLSSCQTLIIFLSQASVESIWAKKEWQSFLSRQLSGKELKILPVLLEDCQVPEILADLKYADFRESYVDGLREIHSALK